MGPGRSGMGSGSAFTEWTGTSRYCPSLFRPPAVVNRHQRAARVRILSRSRVRLEFEVHPDLQNANYPRIVEGDPVGL